MVRCVRVCVSGFLDCSMCDSAQLSLARARVSEPRGGVLTGGRSEATHSPPESAAEGTSSANSAASAMDGQAERAEARHRWIWIFC